MTDELVEKIAKMLTNINNAPVGLEYQGGAAKMFFTIQAEVILKAILSDPSIVEIEPDAELPADFRLDNLVKRMDGLQEELKYERDDNVYKKKLEIVKRIAVVLTEVSIREKKILRAGWVKKKDGGGK